MSFNLRLKLKKKEPVRLLQTGGTMQTAYLKRYANAKRMFGKASGCNRPDDPSQKKARA